MQNIYRHGDLALVEVNELPTGLTEAKTKILLEGKTSTHRVSKGKIYFKDVSPFIFGYVVVPDGAVLLHPEHGEPNGNKVREAKIKSGIYELRRQQEFTHEGMKEVID